MAAQWIDRAKSHDMGTHIKTTVDISDALFKRAKQLAHSEKRTFRELIEEGLEDVLERGARKPVGAVKLPVSGGDGLTAEFSGAGWEKFRDEIYRSHGA
jgi:hypothetical protein